MDTIDTPAILYKYRSLGLRTDEIFSDKKIWLAKPSTLNDPLECKIKPISEQAKKTRSRQAQESHLDGFIWQALWAHSHHEIFFGLQGRDIKRLLTKMKKAEDFNRKYRIANDFLIGAGTPGFSKTENYVDDLYKQMEEVGVFSMTEDPSNMLMWSHYAENHRGIAIGFKPNSTSVLSDSNFCGRVNYSDDLSEFKFSKEGQMNLEISLDNSGQMAAKSYIPIYEKQVQRALFTKTTAWAYEKEWRYVQPHFGSYDLPAPIVEIVFGMNCPPLDRSKFKALVKDSDGGEVQFMESFISPGSTSLAIRPCN